MDDQLPNQESNYEAKEDVAGLFSEEKHEAMGDHKVNEEEIVECYKKEHQHSNHHMMG